MPSSTHTAAAWQGATVWLPLLAWSVLLVLRRVRRDGRPLVLWTGPAGWLCLAGGQVAGSAVAMMTGWALVVTGVWAVVEHPRRARTSQTPQPGPAVVTTQVTGRVVVAVADRRRALPAVLWALHQLPAGSAVELVTAYDPADVVLGTAGSWPAMDGEAAARGMLQGLLDDVRRSVPDARLLLRPLPGRPSSVLLHAAHGAELLVLGQRPVGPWRRAAGSLLAGSTTRTVVRRTTAPLALVGGAPSRGGTAVGTTHTGRVPELTVQLVAPARAGDRRETVEG